MSHSGDGSRPGGTELREVLREIDAIEEQKKPLKAEWHRLQRELKASKATLGEAKKRASSRGESFNSPGILQLERQLRVLQARGAETVRALAEVNARLKPLRRKQYEITKVQEDPDGHTAFVAAAQEVLDEPTLDRLWRMARERSVAVCNHCNTVGMQRQMVRVGGTRFFYHQLCAVQANAEYHANRGPQNQTAAEDAVPGERDQQRYNRDWRNTAFREGRRA